MPVGFPDYYGGLTLPVTVAEGGTGQTSVTAKALLYGAGTSKLIETNIGTANQVLQIDSITLNPTFKDLVVNVSSITGILPVANGGTGTATPALVAGTAISITGTWPGQTINNTSAYASLADPLPVGHGGTGTATGSIAGSGSMVIQTSGTDLTLKETGDTFGTVSLALENRSGLNGALFTNSGLDLVDFGFVTSTAIQFNFRLEHRAGFVHGNSLGEFQFIDESNAGNQYAWIGETKTQFNSAVTANSLTLVTPLPVASGGTGTATPALVAGANIVLSGTWPAQTVAVATPIIIGTKGAATALAIELGSSGIATSYAQFGTNQSTISGVAGDLLNMADGSVGWKVAFDKSGNLGLAGTLHLGTVLSVADGGTGAATLLAAGIPHIVANVDLTAQTAGIVTTALITPGVAGMYRASVEVYLKSTTGTSTIVVNLIWVQEGGNTGNQQALNLSLTATSGVGSGSLLLYSDSGFAISYNTVWTSGGAGDQYDLHIRLEAL